MRTCLYFRNYIVFVLILMSSYSYGKSNLPGDDFLPEPTGHYTIGTYSFSLNNNSPGKKNEKRYTIKVWYPSEERVPEDKYNHYLENYDLEEVFSNFKKMGITMEQVDSIASMRTHSSNGLKISDQEKKYPLLFFTPGYYFGANDIYSAFIENLASNGYIVIAISHVHEQVCVMDPEGKDNSLDKAKAALPYLQMWWRHKRCMRDYHKPKNQERLSNYYLKGLNRFNRKLDQWENSIAYVIHTLEEDKTLIPEEIEDKMDFDNIGLFGQSFGGTVANDMCVKYDFVKSAVNMDGFQFGSISDTISQKPLMLIEGEQQLRWRIGNEYIYRNYPNLNYIKVFDSLHFLFSDLSYFRSVLSKDKIHSLIGEVDGITAIHWLNKEILDFFDHTLKNKDVIFNNGENVKNIDGNKYLIQKSNRCIFLK